MFFHLIKYSFVSLSKFFYLELDRLLNLLTSIFKSFLFLSCNNFSSIFYADWSLLEFYKLTFLDFFSGQELSPSYNNSAHFSIKFYNFYFFVLVLFLLPSIVKCCWFAFIILVANFPVFSLSIILLFGIKWVYFIMWRNYPFIPTSWEF